MTWATTVRARDTLRRWWVLEIEHPTQPKLRWGYNADINSQFGPIRNRLVSLGSIPRSLDPLEGNVGLRPISVTVENSDGYLATILDDYDQLLNLRATLYLELFEPAGTQSREILYSGTTTWETAPAGSLELTVIDDIIQLTTPLQFIVTRTAWPNCRDADLNRGLNIPLGSPSIATTFGLFYCPVVDTAGREIAWAQGSTANLVAGKRSPIALWRHRQSAVNPWTNILPANWTSHSTRLNRTGQQYLYIELAASVYDPSDSDDWYVVPATWTPPSDPDGNYTNAVKAIRALLLEYSQLQPSVFGTSWDAAITELAARSYPLTEWGYNIPLTKGQVQGRDEPQQQWGLISDALRSAGYHLYKSRGGTLEIVQFQPDLPGTPDLDFSELNSDLIGNPSLQRVSAEPTNQIEIGYRTSHRNDTQPGASATLVAKELNSIARYGQRSVEQIINGPWGPNLAADIGKRRVRLSSGMFKRIQFATYLRGLEVDLGDRIAFSHNGMIVALDNQELLVDSVVTNPGADTVEIGGYLVDPTATDATVTDTTDYLIRFAQGLNQGAAYASAFDATAADLTLKFNFTLPADWSIATDLFLNLISMHDESLDVTAVEIYFLNDVGNNPRLNLNIRDAAGRLKRYDISVALAASTVYTCYVNWQQSTNTAKIWINGSEVSALQSTDPSFAGRLLSSQTLTAGAGRSAGAFDLLWRGDLDDIAYQPNYNSGTASITPSDQWTFAAKSLKSTVTDLLLTAYQITDNNFV